MKIKVYYILFLLVIGVSCQDDDAKRETARLKNLEKREKVFETINKNWSFSERQMNGETQTWLSNWSEWRNFLTEIKQKPKSSIGAFKKKSKTLSKKVRDLNNNIPIKFANPQVKSRIAILTTQINSLDLYMNLDNVPAEKVVVLIPEINTALASLQLQFEEIVRKDKIPMEQGESDMIRMLDTTRAIPSSPINKTLPRN
ncbi:hypothetical protein J2X31_000809 [Flavobacterium arsenatis]|uniref:Lipoprotein n=1 Tax=Flavobacterium arsenatis TaxID=1484332 RepID=A0ABU1TLF8_9FLAO|nr:hypothetical protein [Flavobacterium arsenatis]MDR6966811.1 hypothetical protein [Flavobacterium arsenatis]